MIKREWMMIKEKREDDDRGRKRMRSKGEVERMVCRKRKEEIIEGRVLWRRKKRKEIQGRKRMR